MMKSFRNAVPMLFGEEFAKLTTERLKPSQNSLQNWSRRRKFKKSYFFGYHPQNSSREAVGVGVKAAKDSSTLTRRTATTDQVKATKGRNSKKFSHLNCTCVPIDMHTEHDITLNKEGYPNQIVHSKVATEDQWVLEMVQGLSGFLSHKHQYKQNLQERCTCQPIRQT